MTCGFKHLMDNHVSWLSSLSSARALLMFLASTAFILATRQALPSQPSRPCPWLAAVETCAGADAGRFSSSGRTLHFRKDDVLDMREIEKKLQKQNKKIRGSSWRQVLCHRNPRSRSSTVRYPSTVHSTRQSGPSVFVCRTAGTAMVVTSVLPTCLRESGNATARY